MNAAEAFLLSFDLAWNHEWESLLEVLGGVDDEEAAWQAPCYREVEPEAGFPPPGTIRWQVCHIAACKRLYAARLRGKGDAESSDLPPPATRSLREDVAELRAAHEEERAAIAALAPEDVTPAVGTFLANVTRHDTWHASQIAVARRLWRSHQAG